ncbi:hypothetical protein AB4396_00470 [Vibrio cyclitrophicus]|jgi:hypothetical protein|uniref:hypothetical protein n=1 Tax=Vibrio sp. R78045 TaxID=3093868 RepID=UPI00354C8251
MNIQNSMEWLEVELELQLEPESDLDGLKNAVADTVVDNESDFFPIIGAICSQLNDRANYATDSFVVNQVDFDEPFHLEEGRPVGTGSLQASFEWTAYYGCDDLDLHDEAQEVWEFNFNGQTLNFRIQLPEDRLDEF